MFQRDPEYRRYSGEYTQLGEPASRDTQKLGGRKRDLDLCEGFLEACEHAMFHLSFFFPDGNKKPRATPEVFPLLFFENSFAAPDPVGCIYADSPPVRCHQESNRNQPLSSQDIDAARPCDCADSPLFIRSINHIQRSGIQPGELSSSRHTAQTNHSPSGGEYDGVGE